MENIANGLYTVSGIISFIGLLYLGVVIYQKLKKKREVDFSLKKVYNYFLGFLVLAPVIVCLYFFPIVFYDQDFWLEGKSQYIESQNALKLLGISILSFYTLVRGAIFLPHQDEFYNIGPKLLFLSLFPGIASALNVMIISKFITEDFEANYLLFFFAVITFIYIVTSRISKRVTVNFGVLTAHKYNIRIISKIFKIPYRKQEQIEDGKIYTILNDDINSIFSFSQGIINTYTNVITLILVEVYLFTISWVSALLLLGITILVMGIFVLMSPQIESKTNIARLKREKYSNFISGLINGFKELVLHKTKRDKYQKDMEDSSKESYNASQKSINVGIDAGLVSELSFSISIGISCLLFPTIFDMEKEVITAFVLAVLFLWGPVSMILNGVPQIVNLKVSLNRIKSFLKDSETEDLVSNDITEKIETPIVQSIKVKDVCFNYNDKEESITYGIGPINFVANQGELIFVIGGNGSGKTTFLKLLIGLYKPTSGNILINGEKVNNRVLGECFSVIYSDFYLFQKLYDLNEDRLDQVNDWLEVLQLSDKVKIEDGVFSTIDLSKGQRKRLAILKSYLEDKPVYFFDEVAADLDPAFREFFYNELLVKMRQEGKILIIISHDDKYFDLADKIYKMEMGKIFSHTKELLEISEQY